MNINGNYGGDVKVPDGFVKRVKERNQEITVGSLFDEEYGWPSSSWHKYVQKYERWDLMAKVAKSTVYNY
jgi:starvation-inducible outer membrane lipoprotein